MPRPLLELADVEEDAEDVMESKVSELVSLMLDSRRTLVYTGAGLSTAANIPDYRGPNGVWTCAQRGETVKCYDMLKAEPTYSHHVLKELYRMGIVKHILSQNCDGLHLRSGMPQSGLSEIHGNMFIEVCVKCNGRQFIRSFDVTTKTGLRRHETDRCCTKCGSCLYDTIVQFGEKNRADFPYNWLGTTEHVESADLIVCIGSSLTVLKDYSFLWPDKKKSKTKLVIVNLTRTHKDDDTVLCVYGCTDDVLRKVAERLGIEDKPYCRLCDPVLAPRRSARDGELKHKITDCTCSTRATRLPYQPCDVLPSTSEAGWWRAGIEIMHRTLEQEQKRRATLTPESSPEPEERAALSTGPRRRGRPRKISVVSVHLDEPRRNPRRGAAVRAAARLSGESDDQEAEAAPATLVVDDLTPPPDQEKDASHARECSERDAEAETIVKGDPVECEPSEDCAPSASENADSEAAKASSPPPTASSRLELWQPQLADYVPPSKMTQADDSRLVEPATPSTISNSTPTPSSQPLFCVMPPVMKAKALAALARQQEAEEEAARQAEEQRQSEQLQAAETTKQINENDVAAQLNVDAKTEAHSVAKTTADQKVCTMEDPKKESELEEDEDVEVVAFSPTSETSFVTAGGSNTCKEQETAHDVEECAPAPSPTQVTPSQAPASPPNPTPVPSGDASLLYPASAEDMPSTSGNTMKLAAISPSSSAAASSCSWVPPPRRVYRRRTDSISEYQFRASSSQSAAPPPVPEWARHVPYVPSKNPMYDSHGSLTPEELAFQQQYMTGMGVLNEKGTVLVNGEHVIAVQDGKEMTLAEILKAAGRTRERCRAAMPRLATVPLPTAQMQPAAAAPPMALPPPPSSRGRGRGRRPAQPTAAFLRLMIEQQQQRQQMNNSFGSAPETKRRRVYARMVVNEANASRGAMRGHAYDRQSQMDNSSGSAMRQYSTSFSNSGMDFGEEGNRGVGDHLYGRDSTGPPSGSRMPEHDRIRVGTDDPILGAFTSPNSIPFAFDRLAPLTATASPPAFLADSRSSLQQDNFSLFRDLDLTDPTCDTASVLLRWRDNTD